MITITIKIEIDGNEVSINGTPINVNAEQKKDSSILTLDLRENCKRGKRLTEEEKEKIVDLFESGKTINEISIELGKKYSAIHSVVRRLKEERPLVSKKKEEIVNPKIIMKSEQ